jgi:hypothetical protein
MPSGGAAFAGADWSAVTVMGTGEKAEDLKRLQGSLGGGGSRFCGTVSEEQKTRGCCSSTAVHTSIREGGVLNVNEANAWGSPRGLPGSWLEDSTEHGETGL